MSRHRWLFSAVVLGGSIAARSALALGAAPARPSELVGLYQMEVPETTRLSARLRCPASEVAFLPLTPDGQSRLENVTITDRAGTAAATI